MSAPDTNTEKQAKAHGGALRAGIVLPLLWGVGLLLVFVVVMFLRGSEPEGAEEQVDSRTGDTVAAEGAAEEATDAATE